MSDRELIGELAACLQECADDLEQEIMARYDARDRYPLEQRRYDAAIQAVTRARDKIAEWRKRLAALDR